MKWVRSAVTGLVFTAMFLPEVARYVSERRLARATAVFRVLLNRAREVSDPQSALDRVTEMATQAAQGLSGDSRAWILAGSTRLVAGNPKRALDFYGEALARGERAEIDLNLGRAYAVLAQPGKAGAAFLRAGWISPAILSALPEPSPERFRARIAELEAQLRAGRLESPPGLP